MEMQANIVIGRNHLPTSVYIGVLPTRGGRARAYRQFRQLAIRWIKQIDRRQRKTILHGEAIYGSSPWISDKAESSLTPLAAKSPNDVGKDAVNDTTPTATPADLRFTARKDVVYLFARNWKTPLVTTPRFDERSRKVTQVILLGSSERVQWQQRAGNLEITLPPKLPGKIAVHVYRIQIANAK